MTEVLLRLRTCWVGVVRSGNQLPVDASQSTGRWLVGRPAGRLSRGLLAVAYGMVSMALMAGVADLTDEPLIFPSLGPTAFLIFSAPHAPSASPRNAVVGHLIGTLAGYLSLLAFGLVGAGPAIEHVTAARVGAAALSIGLTFGAMIVLDTPHAPAGATTLIISLGLLTGPFELGMLMLGVVLLVAQGYVVNRLAGVDYPAWSPRQPPG